jgi:hypothetical protein
MKQKKTYIVTDKDIEILSQLFPDLGEGLTVSRIIEEWVETLNYLDATRAYNFGGKRVKTDEKDI